MKKKALIIAFFLFIPSISYAHEFWIFRLANEVRIYGGHDFPRTEAAPGKNILVHSYLFGESGIKELSLEREKDFLFSKGIEEKGVLSFRLERGERVLYCGFYIAEEGKIKEEFVEKTCGDAFSMAVGFKEAKEKKEVVIEFSKKVSDSWELWTEKGEKKILLIDPNGRLSFKGKGGLYLLVSNIGRKSVSIVVEVK